MIMTFFFFPPVPVLWFVFHNTFYNVEDENKNTVTFKMKFMFE